MCVFEDGSRRSSRCKPGERDFGSVAIAAHKRAPGVWGRKKKGWQASSNRRRFRGTGPHPGTEERRRRWRRRGGTGISLFTRVVVVVDLPWLPMASTSARGGGGDIRVLHADDANRTWPCVGLCSPEKARGSVVCGRTSLAWPPLLDGRRDLHHCRSQTLWLR